MTAPELRSKAGALQSTMERWSTRCDSCHEVAAKPGGLRANIAEVAALAAQSEQILAENDKIATEIQQIEYTGFNADAAATDRAYSQARIAVGVLVLISALAAGVIFVVVRRLTSRLRSTASHLRAGADQVLLVDRRGEHRIQPAGQVGFPFFGRLIRDCLDRTETAMTQEHAFLAAELCLRAQAQAVRVAG